MADCVSGPRESTEEAFHFRRSLTLCDGRNSVPVDGTAPPVGLVLNSKTFRVFFLRFSAQHLRKHFSGALAQLLRGLFAVSSIMNT